MNREVRLLYLLEEIVRFMLAHSAIDPAQKALFAQKLNAVIDEDNDRELLEGPINDEDRSLVET